MNDTRQSVANYGEYHVIFDPLAHRPYGLYRIYYRSRYIGAQISFPNRSDCDCLRHNAAVYAFGHPDNRSKRDNRRGATSPEYIEWRLRKRAAA